MGHSSSCTSLSTSVRKSTVTSRSPLGRWSRKEELGGSGAGGRIQTEISEAQRPPGLSSVRVGWVQSKGPFCPLCPLCSTRPGPWLPRGAGCSYVSGPRGEMSGGQGAGPQRHKARSVDPPPLSGTAGPRPPHPGRRPVLPPWGLGGMSCGCPCSRGLRACQLCLHVTGLAHWALGQVPSTGRPGPMATPGPGQPLGMRGTESAARWTSHFQPPFQGRKPFSGPGSVACASPARLPPSGYNF